MSQRLTILHLSDLQFGRHHRYPDGEKSRRELFHRLRDDLTLLRDEHQLAPNMLAVTGDLAEEGLPSEFHHAREFLELLITHTKIAKEHVLLIPGNHDINWDHSQGARLMAKGSGESFEPPYFPKFWNYQRFFNDFYDGAGRFLFDEDHLFHVWPFPAEKILIAGFNSCIIESEQTDEHYGHIGVDQVRQVLLACDDVDPENTWLRIAALHHNFIGGSDLDNENLRDRDDILPLLQKGKFRLVLHGHRHIAEAQQFGSVNHETLRVLAAGSAGLDHNALPDHPNQYQVIRIDESGEVSVFMRQFSAQAFGLSGKGKWAADTSVDESGIVRFTLASQTQQAQSAKSKKKRPGSFETARKTFLTFVREEMKFLPLRGFGVDLRVPLELEPVYISLRAMPHHDFDTRDHDTEGRPNPDDIPDLPQPPDREIDGPQELEIGPALSLSEQQGYAGLVVLGDPGSGKTTLLKYVALCLAKGRRETRSRIPKGRLPLFLPLRDVDTFEHPLEETLRRHYARNGLTLPDDFFTRILGARRCVILLDGLDEVATLDRRRDAGRWIEAARKVWPGNPIVVTSRFAGYVGEARLPGHFLELNVRDFSPADIRRFVRNWYEQVETRTRGDKPQWRDAARRLADDLLQHLERQPAVKQLAANPLMLQIISLVHRSRGTMPARRTELYERCIEVLLQNWDEAKGLDVYLTATEARQVLRPLALWLHGEEGRTHADADEVRRVVLPHLQRVKREQSDRAEEQLDRVLISVRDRSGLFVGFDVRRYGFQHLSFQEFLAAEELVKLGAVDRLLKNFGRNWWRETTLLSLGLDEPQFQHRFFHKLLRSKQLAEKLEWGFDCVREALTPPIAPFAELLNDKKRGWEEQHRAVLLLREIGGPDAVAVLEAALKHSHQQVATAARDALVQLGALDSELAETPAVDGTPQTIINSVDSSELVLIPAGEFLMGSNDHEKNERPQHTVHLDDYYIARTPVTNAQYARFLEATGHGKPAYWDNKRYNKPNQPVVGVTWHDAVAYCKWAGGRLPTESEWEKAARGVDGRLWPWGNEAPDHTRCNFNGKIGFPTEVGSYPAGASPYGCVDMAGNVWEWCATKWREGYDKPEDNDLEGDGMRMIRGGAHYSSQVDVRCGYRDRLGPGYRGYFRGFRFAQSSPQNSGS